MTVGGNLQVQNNKAKVTVGGNKVGGNKVGGNLQVQGNEMAATITKNTATGKVQVQHNAGGTLTSNEAQTEVGRRHDG